MKPFWTPLSAVILADLGVFAPPVLLKMRLAAGQRVDLVYAGDRMSPALRHGQSLPLRPAPDGPIAPGTVVLAVPGGVPDVLRVKSCRGEELILCADSDPADAVALRRGEILAVVEAPAASGARAVRLARRVVLDVREACLGRIDPGKTAEETVRRKYEAQAAFYAAERESKMDPLLLGRLRERAAPGGRILVAGSGTGRECLALEAEGWSVTGIDFSPAMIALARKETRAKGSRVEHRQADLREHQEPPGSLAAVLFTYEVYSFLGDAGQRIEVLRRMRTWLGRGGIVLLSARTVRGVYERLILSLEFLRPRRGREGSREWGGSHSRWISPGGELSRSFLRHFTRRALRKEAERAGFTIESWQGGHAVLVPREREKAGGRAGERSRMD